MDIHRNLQLFLQGSGKHLGVQPEERYASFDYCYNYFQGFREQGCLERLVDAENIQQSCLQIGFYLASWGMLRGSTFLLRKSMKFYERLIWCIAETDAAVWRIDADCYTEQNIHHLLETERSIRLALSGGGVASDTLVTKIMLGVFGNVPAFDDFFKRGFQTRWSGRKALLQIGDYYRANQSVIDSYSIPTIDFISGQKTHRLYTKAKIIDMIGFIEGQS